MKRHRQPKNTIKSRMKAFCTRQHDAVRARMFRYVRRPAKSK